MVRETKCRKNQSHEKTKEKKKQKPPEKRNLPNDKRKFQIQNENPKNPEMNSRETKEKKEKRKKKGSLY